MDKGKLIAEGRPKDLLKKTFETSVIEIPVEVTSLSALQENFLEVVEGDKTFDLTVKDLNSALTQLAAMNLDLSGLNIRQKNLEDLFIHLTGKDLRS